VEQWRRSRFSLARAAAPHAACLPPFTTLSRPVSTHYTASRCARHRAALVPHCTWLYAFATAPRPAAPRWRGCVCGIPARAHAAAHVCCARTALRRTCLPAYTRRGTTLCACVADPQHLPRTRPACVNARVLPTWIGSRRCGSASRTPPSTSERVRAAFATLRRKPPYPRGCLPLHLLARQNTARAHFSNGWLSHPSLDRALQDSCTLGSEQIGRNVFLLRLSIVPLPTNYLPLLAPTICRSPSSFLKRLFCLPWHAFLYHPHRHFAGTPFPLTHSTYLRRHLTSCHYRPLPGSHSRYPTFDATQLNARLPHTTLLSPSNRVSYLPLHCTQDYLTACPRRQPAGTPPFTASATGAAGLLRPGCTFLTMYL